MTTKELLNPRWKVIANFPGNTFYIGEVFEIPLDCKLQQIILQGNDYSQVDLDIDPQFYPAVFKKLEWWEERKKEDMPEYVELKCGEIVKVKRYWTLGIITNTNESVDFINISPSTKEEYLNQ